MPQLQYLADGSLVLPRDFLNDLMTVLSELPDFEKELSLVSNQFGSARSCGLHDDWIVIGVLFRKYLKETLVRLCREEFEVYTGLKETYAEANLMRDLVL
jgi:hypothetical protein